MSNRTQLPDAETVSAVAERPTLETEVLTVVALAGERGLTDEEICLAVRDRGRLAKESSTRARRVALVEAGLVVDSGRTRETSCGFKARVWIATRGDERRSQRVFEGFEEPERMS